MNAITALKGKMPSIPWSKMGKVPALLRREFLDHKIGFFTIPWIVAGLTLFVLLLGLVDQVVIDGKSIVNELENAIVELEDGHVSSQQESKEIVSTIFTGGSALGLIMILPFVVFFGLLASLYDDRKDR
ncbi:MAG: hypothetical protein IIC07_05820, partial [Proteobacteria bacterium]|nr:hypothetical protein [Pseudomonadota bacterium]